MSKAQRDYVNPGCPPKRWLPETLVEIEWANGTLSRQPYRVDQLVWERRGWAYDIARFWRAG